MIDYISKNKGGQIMNHPDNYKEAYEETRCLYEAMRQELKTCRNELCLRCGNYREKHLGACDGCRWKEVG